MQVGKGAYGGDVWFYAGSLGCINTPYDAVSTIYQYVNYGTFSVICHCVVKYKNKTVTV